jgi:predicted HTH domain antitoxin
MALNENGMIERSTLGFLYKKLRDNGFEKQEPEPLSYLQKNEKLFALTKKLLIQGKLTTNKAAEVLNISLKEMRELLKRWKNFEYKKN